MSDNPSTGAARNDACELGRYLAAQEGVYAAALAELQAGQKRSHWMWFVFPQVQGLGHSGMAVRYAITSRDEARQYFAHPVLGSRLRACAAAVLAVDGRSAADIFGYPDDLKLRSSMTLFAAVAEPGSVFSRVLDQYFQGEQDVMTLEVLETMKR